MSSPLWLAAATPWTVPGQGVALGPLIDPALTPTCLNLLMRMLTCTLSLSDTRGLVLAGSFDSVTERLVSSAACSVFGGLPSLVLGHGNLVLAVLAEVVKCPAISAVSSPMQPFQRA